MVGEQLIMGDFIKLIFTDFIRDKSVFVSFSVDKKKKKKTNNTSKMSSACMSVSVDSGLFLRMK